MDFDKFDTVSGADKGAWLHLKHPALGHLLYTGKGADEDGRLIKKEEAKKVRVFVQGMECEAVQNIVRDFQKKKLTSDDSKEEEGFEIGCALVTDFDGIEKDGEPLTATKENKIAFFKKSSSLVEQVTQFASNRANFYAAG